MRVIPRMPLASLSVVARIVVVAMIVWVALDNPLPSSAAGAEDSLKQRVPTPGDPKPGAATTAVEVIAPRVFLYDYNKLASVRKKERISLKLRNVRPADLELAGSVNVPDLTDSGGKKVELIFRMVEGRDAGRFDVVDAVKIGADRNRYLRDLQRRSQLSFAHLCHFWRQIPNAI